MPQSSYIYNPAVLRMAKSTFTKALPITEEGEMELNRKTRASYCEKFFQMKHYCLTV